MPPSVPLDAQALDSAPVLSTIALTTVYGAGRSMVEALQHMDLELRRGELVVLLGLSGSGKSTLLNILSRLDVPTSGHVYFEGSELTAYG